MKNNLLKAIVIILTFFMVFSGLPFLAGNLEAIALTKKKLPKNITLYAAADGQTQVELKWNKINSPSKGYAVFRNGQPVAHLNTKKIVFTDKNLEAGTSYTYQIKTYTKKTVKMWFNKKTEKWQKKKPARKYRGKSKKEAVYTYKKKSNAVTIHTAAAPAPSTPADTGDNDNTGGNGGNNGSDSSDSAQATYTITWKNWDGTVLETDSVKEGATPSYNGTTPTRPADQNYTYTFNGWDSAVVAANGDKTYTAVFTKESKPAAATKYKYDIHLLNEPYGNGGETAIYLETNNPNKFNYELGLLNASGQNKKLNIADGFYSGASTNKYTDIDTTNFNGYVCKCSPECAGNCTFVVYEFDDEGNEKIAASKSVYIKDFFEEEQVWMQSVINEVTTSSMTNKQKMQAISGYLKADFTYPWRDNDGNFLYLITEEALPYWEKRKLNSYTSPAVLVEFGKLLGYPLHNCYNDYPEGTSEWSSIHYFAYSEADKTYYSALPDPNSGTIDPSTITMFDPSTYQFWSE